MLDMLQRILIVRVWFGVGYCSQLCSWSRIHWDWREKNDFKENFTFMWGQKQDKIKKRDLYYFFRPSTQAII